MPLLNFDFKTARLQAEEEERRKRLGQRFNSLLGKPPVSVEGGFEGIDLLDQGGDFVDEGAPLDVRSLQPERVEEATGFQATDQGAIARSKLMGNILQAGGSVTDATTLLSDIRASGGASKLAKAKLGKEIEDRTSSLRKERTKEITPFLTAYDKAAEAVQVVKNGTGIGDLVGVVDLLKTIDPRSVAREGEVNSVAAAAGLIEQGLGMVNKITGQGILSETARKELSDVMAQLQDRAASNAEGIDKFFQSESGKAGTDSTRLRIRDNVWSKEGRLARSGDKVDAKGIPNLLKRPNGDNLLYTPEQIRQEVKRRRDNRRGK